MHTCARMAQTVHGHACARALRTCALVRVRSEQHILKSASVIWLAASMCTWQPHGTVYNDNNSTDTSLASCAGLDSFAAFSVMSHLQNLAQTNKQTVIATIHQPRSAIWQMFDSVRHLPCCAANPCRFDSVSISTASVQCTADRIVCHDNCGQPPWLYPQLLLVQP